MKHYIGKGKEGNFDSINCSICLDDIKQFVFTGSNGKQYISFTVAPMREADKFGKTHTLYVWDEKEKAQNQTKKNDKSDDIPF